MYYINFIFVAFEFQNLTVYRRAKEFHILCNQFIQSTDANKTVKDQLFRASFSIALNIAEGSGRFSKPDRKNFFTIARSSIFECVAIFDILNDNGNIPVSQFNMLLEKADHLSRMLFTMVRNLNN